MEETNNEVKKVSEEQKLTGKVERMYLTLQLTPKESNAYNKSLQRLTEKTDVTSSEDNLARS